MQESLVQAEEGDMQPENAAVCMVAYTNYEFDARVRREAETLVQQGYSVTCLTPSNGRGRRVRELGGVQVKELGTRKYRGKSTLRYTLSYLAFLANASLATTGLLAKRSMDAVHVHNIPDFLVFAALLPRLMGKKVILDVHDSVPETFASKFPTSHPLLFRLLCLEERISTWVCHRIICVNHPQRQRLVDRGIPQSKTFISLNAPDYRLFRPRTPQPAQEGQETFRMIYHGTMARRLGVDLIIRAVSRLRERIPGLQLHLWGQGDDLPEFQNLARQLDLEEMVHFEPQGVPLPELPARLVGMDLGIVGNRRNIATELMLPVKLLEYVALGIPAVAPRLESIQHYFSDEMVRFYPAEDEETMAEAILEMYRDPHKRYRQACRAQDFLQSHGWEKQEHELIDLYQNLLKG